MLREPHRMFEPIQAQNTFMLHRGMSSYRPMGVLYDTSSTHTVNWRSSYA